MSYWTKLDILALLDCTALLIVLARVVFILLR